MEQAEYLQLQGPKQCCEESAPGPAVLMVEVEKEVEVELEIEAEALLVLVFVYVDAIFEHHSYCLQAQGA